MEFARRRTSIGSNKRQTARFFLIRILVVTNMLPTPDASHMGCFIQQQIEALRRIGLVVEVLFVDRAKKGMRAYASLPAMLGDEVAVYKPDLVHVIEIDRSWSRFMASIC
jgi:hypothetical protein